MKVLINYILLSSTVMAADTFQGIPQQPPLSPPTQQVNQKQALLTSLMATAIVAPTPEGLGEQQEDTNRKNKKRNQRGGQNQKPYRPSPKDKSQKQNHSRYPGR